MFASRVPSRTVRVFYAANTILQRDDAGDTSVANCLLLKGFAALFRIGYTGGRGLFGSANLGHPYS